MQYLQHCHHDVKEVIAKEGRVELQWVYQRAVQDPEGHDNQPSNDENDGEDNEDVVAGVFPSRVVKHLGGLQQGVRRVMQSHDESPCSDVIGKPGEAEENDGGHMVDDLFLKILSLDIRSNAEEQGPVEGKFDYVVPVLRREDALYGVSLPNLSQVIEPGFIHSDRHASNKGNQVIRESPAGFSELLEDTGPVLVAAAAEPAFHLASREPTLPRQKVYLHLLGLLATGQVEML